MMEGGKGTVVVDHEVRVGRFRKEKCMCGSDGESRLAGRRTR